MSLWYFLSFKCRLSLVFISFETFLDWSYLLIIMKAHPVKIGNRCFRSNSGIISLQKLMKSLNIFIIIFLFLKFVVGMSTVNENLIILSIMKNERPENSYYSFLIDVFKRLIRLYSFFLKLFKITFDVLQKPLHKIGHIVWYLWIFFNKSQYFAKVQGNIDFLNFLTNSIYIWTHLKVFFFNEIQCFWC